MNGVIIINTKTKYNSGDDIITPRVRNVDNEGEPIFYKVEVMPEFPGGVKALKEFLQNEIEYPAIAKKLGIQGKIYVTFIVTKEGKVTEPEITRGVDPMLDEEALHVASKLPDWKPGKQNGEVVNVSYTVPVDFVLPSVQGFNKDASVETKNALFVVNGKEYNRDIHDINPETIASVTVLKDAKATDKYGVKGKDGVIEVTLKPENITTDLKLRKFIAREVKYPVEAQDNGIVGRIAMAVTFNKDGKIVKVDKSRPKYKNLDEVAVVGTNPENKPHIQNDDSELLKQELIRIINLIPVVDIDEFKGNKINIIVSFSLQD